MNSRGKRVFRDGAGGWSARVVGSPALVPSYHGGERRSGGFQRGRSREPGEGLTSFAVGAEVCGVPGFPAMRIRRCGRGGRAVLAERRVLSLPKLPALGGAQGDRLAAVVDSERIPRGERARRVGTVRVRRADGGHRGGQSEGGWGRKPWPMEVLRCRRESSRPATRSVSTPFVGNQPSGWFRKRDNLRFRIHSGQRAEAPGFGR